MCQLLRHLYTACVHADNEGKKPYNAPDRPEIALIQFCKAALREADHDGKRTRLCRSELLI